MSGVPWPDARVLNLRWDSTLSGLASLGTNTLGSSVAGIQHAKVFRRWDSTLSGLPSLGFGPPSLGLNTLGSI